jgi:threonine dehydratase
MTLDDVFVARRRIAGLVRRTPLVHSAWLSAISGGRVYLKLESLQVTNSFKARGAANYARALVETLPPGASSPTLVTASAGNHGRAFAWACRELGLRTIVFTPRDAARTKLDAIRRLGADLRPDADGYEDSERLAKEFARENGLAYVSPYSHLDIIAGAGTIAVEILEDLPDADTIVVPVGGGGLISGMAVAGRAIRPDMEIVGAEVEASPAFSTALANGRITEVVVRPTLADGLAGNMDPDTITFDLVRRLVARVVVVSEDQLETGIRGLAAEEHLIAEGAGIAGVAAVLSGRADAGGRRVAIVVSGSNIDAARLARVLGKA